MTDNVDEFLAHHGVLGMKWGKRKAEARNANYSKDQSTRDKQIYGQRAVNRINKSLNTGSSISTARSAEKTRRDHVMSKNKYVRQGGKAAGAIGGAAAGYLAVKGISSLVNSSIGRKAVLAMMGSGKRNSFMKSTLVYHQIREGVTAYTDNPAVRTLVAAGAAKVGHMMAGDIAVSANMRINGYDPNRKN